MDQHFDFLIAFHAVTTQSEEPGRGRPTTSGSTFNNLARALGDDGRHPESVGRVLEVNWCAYDIRQQMVSEETQFFVRPDQFIEVNEMTLRRLMIRPEDLQSAVPFSEVMSRFNDFVYLNFIRNNVSFCLVTYSDEVLSRILPNEARECKIKIPPHFNQYFEILSEFRKFYPQTFHVKNIGEMLMYLKLKDIQGQDLCQTECKNTVRIINRLVKDGHKFLYPKIINSGFQVISENTEDRVIKRERENKRWSTFIRSKSPEPFRNPLKAYYVRMRGLPLSSKENDILEFLRGIRVFKEDIAFLYDLEGKFSGEAYVKLCNESDMKEALCLNLNNIGDKFVEIFETTENEYNKAKLSQFPDQREVNPDTRITIETILRSNPGILKARGLPFTCTEQDIVNFFKSFNLMKDGIKRPIIGGKPSGEAFILFMTREDAQKALSLNMEKIGHRFIELFPATVREFENFMMHNFINSGPCYSKDYMPNIPADKRRSTIMVVGLPLNTTKDEVAKFFNSFDLKESDIHLLPSHSGKFSGNALVIFEDEMEARRAMKTKNLTHINNRFVELYEYKQ